MITENDRCAAATAAEPATDAELQATLSKLSRIMTEHDLCAAAATIDDMPDSEIRSKFSQLARAREARSQSEVLRLRVELENLELDAAAYGLARQAERAGELTTAAHWYSSAAMNDFADSPLRLARVLDRLARKHQAGSAGQAASREESYLVTEAARWYLSAFAAGEIGATAYLDDLLARHDLAQRADTACNAAAGGKTDSRARGGQRANLAFRASGAHLPGGAPLQPRPQRNEVRSK